MSELEKPAVVQPEILQIAPYKPGTSRIRGVKNPIKLSSNENPFGASPNVITAMEKVINRQHRYPDGNCQELRSAIAECYDIPADQIVCGAGSDELIALLCQAYAGHGDEIIYSEHGFLMYPISALRVGATPVTAPEKNLKLNIEDILAHVTECTKIVFVANPNNPTGSYLTKQEMRELRASLAPHILLVIDAAYAEYVTADDYSNGLGMVTLHNNTVMIRTFSKIYGLGGLRLGWAFCPPEITDILNRIRGPFNVSDIAQAAGVAAIQDQDFIRKARDHNSIWLPKLSQALIDIGLTVHPSVANFILVEFPSDRNATDADHFLQSKGVIGRQMSGYNLPDCMRFTIGLAEENQALIDVLTEFMS